MAYESCIGYWVILHHNQLEGDITTTNSSWKISHMHMRKTKILVVNIPNQRTPTYLSLLNTFPQKNGHWSSIVMWKSIFHGNNPTKKTSPWHHRIQSIHTIDKFSWSIHELSYSWNEFSWRLVKYLLTNSSCGWASILDNNTNTKNFNVKVNYKLY